MVTAAFELLVDSIQDGMVIGTNCGETDIPLGTTFTAARLIGHGNYLTPQFVGDGALALRLITVHWFNREINVVPFGHSAGLTFSGLGLDWLMSTLRDLSYGEYIVLVAGSTTDAASV